MRIISPWSIIAVSAALAVVVSITPDTYFECEQYPGDQWDQIDKTNRECMRENVDGVDTMFCRHWECAQLTCPEEEQLTWMDGCKSCQGFCSSGGTIYPEGSNFICADNTNYCSCMEGGGFASTQMGFTRQKFCNATIVDQ
ncbi:uncharacterized protein LOC128185827 [Crassostrea angulata]|uniref:uncharacterized protein LOC128185827 n=1 Tax=Magallana angulata TaxID=2784310 RepID=UPI0022B1B1DD|nr:uncharacterized protein LOC128185827 [Crassostrea angulata]